MTSTRAAPYLFTVCRAPAGIPRALTALPSHSAGREGRAITPTPLDARRFFAGRWKGEGELVPHGPARLVLARRPVGLEGEGEWLGETLWRVRERFDLGAGLGFERRMFMEAIAPGRVHATADDMPLGAEIELDAQGFRFRRFRSWLVYRGVRLRLGCTSEARVAADGMLHAVIRLDFLRVPVATLRLAIRVERP